MEQSELTETSAAAGASKQHAAVAVALFLAIAILMGVDVAGDLDAGVDAIHVMVEMFVIVLAAGGVAALWWGFQTAKARAATLDTDLKAARIEASRYKDDAREAMRGLGVAIDSQFARWELTPAEREIGLLILKGLSHRDIAQLRATSEPTVRQQALMIYRKSGLRNRSELSAFFMEDLLLPRDA